MKLEAIAVRSLKCSAQLKAVVITGFRAVRGAVLVREIVIPRRQRHRVRRKG